MSGGGIPCTRIPNQGGLPALVPLVAAPPTLEAARRFFARLPPTPPGRTITVPMSQLTKKPWRCHRCHGWSDERHASFPLGAIRCMLEHDDRCPGGIVAGKDRKGREWSACPPDYLGHATSEQISLLEGSENEEVERVTDDEYSDSEEYQPAMTSLESLHTSGSSILSKISASLVTSTSGCSTTTVSSIQQPPIIFSSESISNVAGVTASGNDVQHESAMEELALLQVKQKLARMQQERQALEEQAKIQQQQETQCRESGAEEQQIAKLKRYNSQA